ncbi:MAG: hypothetical protein FWH51_05550 [Dehalococcoidia bacterium]|nr:hypothetical protein [Dehalococcoidia bacterium]
MRLTRFLKPFLCSLLLFLASSQAVSAAPVPLNMGTDEHQVRVPLVLDLSHAIAGAEFAFEYSNGLVFVAYEKSAAVSSAATTPVVTKGKETRLGFYNTDNRYAPSGGKLDTGFLVFSYAGSGTESVTLSEIKLVQVIDQDTTHSEFLDSLEFTISRSSGLTSLPNNPAGTSPNSTDTTQWGNSIGNSATPSEDAGTAPTDDTTTSPGNTSTTPPKSAGTSQLGDTDTASAGDTDSVNLNLPNTPAPASNTGLWLLLFLGLAILGFCGFIIIKNSHYKE